MASFVPVQRPTEAPKLANVNHTVQGAEHPIATQFVESVLKKARINIGNRQLREETQRFRQSIPTTLQPTTLNSRLMREERGMLLGHLRGTRPPR